MSWSTKQQQQLEKSIYITNKKFTTTTITTTTINNNNLNDNKKNNGKKKKNNKQKKLINPKEYWNTVSKYVNKKTAKECHDRFFIIRAQLLLENASFNAEQRKKKEQSISTDDSKINNNINNTVDILYEKIKIMKNPKEKEIALIKRRYPESFSSINTNCFRIQFRPTDTTIPNIRFRTDGIQLQITVPDNYPSSTPLIFNTISLKRNKWLGRKFTKSCEIMLNSTGTDDANEKQPLIRTVLNCFDRNINMAIGLINEKDDDESNNNNKNNKNSKKKKKNTSSTKKKIKNNNNNKKDASTTMKMWKGSEITELQNALRKYPKLHVDNDADANMAEMERWFLISQEMPDRSMDEVKYAYNAIVDHLKHGKPLLITKADILVDKSKDTTTTTTNNNNDNNKSMEENQDGKETAIDDGIPKPIFIEPRPVGTKIMLHKLILGRIGISQCVELKLLSLCTRCGEKNDVITSYEKPSSMRCTSCSSSHRVVYQPNTLHSQTEILGYVETQNCVVFDYLPSNFIVSCMECAENSYLTNVEIAKAYESTCKSCNTHMKLQFQSVDFFDAVDGTEISSDKGKKSNSNNKKKNKDKVTGLRRGQPLPGKGVCVHYRKSFRWFRFPCCKKLYPCDICHENSKDCDAVNAWATRIVCGACSFEQPTTNKTCTSCSFSFGPRRTKFWEGGKGNRDRKFHGRYKTKSKKSMRVGDAKKKKDSEK